MNVVLVQTAFLGDVVLSLPLCKALRNSGLVQDLTVVTTPQAADLVRASGVATNVVVYDKRNSHKSASAAKELATSIATTGVDVAIVPHRSWRTMTFVRALKAKQVITYSNSATRYIASTVLPYNEHGYDVIRQLRLAQPILGASLPSLEATLPIRLYADADEEWVGSQLSTRTGAMVVLAPGSAWATKQWPKRHFVELAAKLHSRGHQVVVIGDKAAALDPNHGIPLTDLCGKTTLGQAAAVMARANVVVSNDSSPVHIASLQGVPVVSIFGPTSPAFGFAPFGKNFAIAERTDLDCRPCTIHGTQRCPLGTHACMVGIEPEYVLQLTENIIHAHDGNRHA